MLLPDLEQRADFEEKKVAFSSWVASLALASREGGPIHPIDREIVKAVLTAHGADFGVLEDGAEASRLRLSLSKYTNEGRAEAMKAIWGEKFQAYKRWSKNEWIPQYEKAVLKGRELPKLGEEPTEGKPDKRIKNSGMIQFLGELTAYAAGDEYVTTEAFAHFMLVRIHNGRVWEEYPDRDNRKKHNMKVETPTSEGEEIKISSIPPQFPQAAWAKIQTFR